MDKHVKLVPMKDGFSKGIVKLAERNPYVFCLGADISKSVGVHEFKELFPNRFISLGIAEQNIIGFAAGLALSGKIPFVSTYAAFSAMRTTDQIRVSVCYNNLPVKIGGAHAGISVGQDGATHQALEDIAVMRSLPKMTVLSPCDATQTEKAVIASVEQIQGPCYIRYCRESIPDFTNPYEEFKIGKAQILKKGSDISLIATGSMVWHAINASKILKELSINAEVINIHTIKPIDSKTIIETAKKTKHILCIEEHQIHGGLGSAVAEIIVQNYPIKMKLLGMPDCFGESGSPNELLEKYKLNSDSIVQQSIKLLK